MSDISEKAGEGMESDVTVTIVLLLADIIKICRFGRWVIRLKSIHSKGIFVRVQNFSCVTHIYE